MAAGRRALAESTSDDHQCDAMLFGPDDDMVTGLILHPDGTTTTPTA